MFIRETFHESREFSNQQFKLDKVDKKNMICFVPGCRNRSRETNKLFFGIPRQPDVKDLWYKTVGYTNDCVRKSSPLCCEDHFNLREDMENYMRYRMMGGQKKLKKGILPRFNLPKIIQLDEQNLEEMRNMTRIELDPLETNLPSQIDKNIVIKTELDFLDEAVLPETNILNEMDGNIIIKMESDSAEMEFTVPQGNLMGRMDGCEVNLSVGNILRQKDGSIGIKIELDSPEPEMIDELNESIVIKEEPNLSEIESDLSDREEERRWIDDSNQQTDDTSPANKSEGIKNMMNLLNENSGSEYAYNLDSNINGINPKESSKNRDLLSLVNHDHQPYIRSSTKRKNKPIDTSTSPEKNEQSSEPVSKETKFESDFENLKVEVLKSRMFETRTKIFIENDPLLFLGVPKDSMHIIENMQKSLNIPLKHIYCVLKKIRLNLPNEVLSYDFGLSYSQISHIFKKTVPLIAQFLKDQIFWPDEKDISENLPIPFRKCLKKVQSIINILEIKVKKSGDQGTRLLSHESIDTARFLISSTPEGFINFLSTRYNKRDSDASIVENSGFLNVLPADAQVLALLDCGFKFVDTSLKRKNCKLIRLPGLSLKRNSKEESRFLKRLASLRIHVKRSMNQLMAFKILGNSINLGKCSGSLLNDIVTIAAALINMQHLSARNQEDPT